MFEKSRLDALTDGIFAVAMTILVLDLHPPEMPGNDSNTTLAEMLLSLMPKLFVYGWSFGVLGLTWMNMVRQSSKGPGLQARQVRLALVLLFFVTLLPFSTMLLTRFPATTESLWLYCGNLAAIMLARLCLLHLTPPDLRHDDHGRFMATTLLFMVSILLVAGLGPVLHRHALWALALNIMPPFWLKAKAARES